VSQQVHNLLGIQCTDKGKPVERQGRNATGPRLLRDGFPPRRTPRPPGCRRANS